MSEQARLLIVDDDASVVAFLVEMLSAAGYACVGESHAPRAITLAHERDFDVVICDIEMPLLRGPEFLAALHVDKPELPLIFISAFASVDTAVACMRAGATDFVTKPFKIEVLQHALTRVLRERVLSREVNRLRAAATQRVSTRGIVAESDAMKRLLDLAERAARSDTPVLLTGESGTGKGAVARYIHDASARHGAFVALNCAALPATLIESELFGVKRGAYTDAREDRDGLFVSAQDGTLFLDEIGDLPMAAQPKMLHALESRRVRPVGGTKEVAVDARLIAASNRSLEEALREQRLRPDLYYRLNVIRLELPALRERRDDIPALVDAYLPVVCRRTGRRVVAVSERAQRWLLGQPWTGNVRELLNVLERAVALSDGNELSVDDFTRGTQPQRTPNGLAAASSERWSLQRVEVEYVKQVLADVGGNKAEAARVLGIDRRTLYSKLREAEVNQEKNTGNLDVFD